MSTRRQAALLNNHSLLAAGVQSLLQDVEGLELSVVSTRDPDANQKLLQLAPEVIVLDSGDASLGEGGIARLASEHPGARIVSLNLRRTGIEIHQVHRIVEANLDGLLEAIWGGPQLPTEEPPQGMTYEEDAGMGGAAMGP